MLHYWFPDYKEIAPDSISKIPFEMRRYIIPYATPFFLKAQTFSFLQQVFSLENIEMEHVHFSVNSKITIHFSTKSHAFQFYFILEGKFRIILNKSQKPLTLKKKSFIFNYLQADAKHILQLEEGKYTILYFLLPVERMTQIMEENPALRDMKQDFDNMISGAILPETKAVNKKMKGSIGPLAL